MTDVDHISRKGPGVPISWFPVPEDLQGLFRAVSSPNAQHPTA